MILLLQVPLGLKWLLNLFIIVAKVSKMHTMSLQCDAVSDRRQKKSKSLVIAALLIYQPVL